MTNWFVSRAASVYMDKGRTAGGVSSRFWYVVPQGLL